MATVDEDDGGDDDDDEGVRELHEDVELRERWQHVEADDGVDVELRKRLQEDAAKGDDRRRRRCSRYGIACW